MARTSGPRSTPTLSLMSDETPSVNALLVCSGKGGVGTSVVASLVALAAVERGERVLLVDASESSSSLHLLLGVRPERGLWMLAKAESNPADAITPIDTNFAFVAGGAIGGASTPSSDHERRAALSRLASVYPSYDLVVFDGGSRLDTITAITQLVEPSLLLVTSADRLALAANYALVKAVATQTLCSTFVVANRHRESLAQEACAFLTGACSHFLKRDITVVGAIPDDPCLQAAVGAGMSVRDAVDGSPAADTMRGVLARVIPSLVSTPRPTAPPSTISTPIWRGARPA